MVIDPMYNCLILAFGSSLNPELDEEWQKEVGVPANAAPAPP
jgi:hypothetical protein